MFLKDLLKDLKSVLFDPNLFKVSDEIKKIKNFKSILFCGKEITSFVTQFEWLITNLWT